MYARQKFGWRTASTNVPTCVECERNARNQKNSLPSHIDEHFIRQEYSNLKTTNTYILGTGSRFKIDQYETMSDYQCFLKSKKYVSTINS
jgi:hypothetical protein